MQTHDDILELVRQKGAEAARKMQRGLIVQPGAIGDCILTLPLAAYMKDALDLGGIDILGHTEYIGFLPGRSCIDSVRSIDSIDVHRLFAEIKKFVLNDQDPLINAFRDYGLIVTFLGEPNSNFEQNLIFTANCSHSAEVITLTMKPPTGFSRHLADFYIRQFIEQSGFSLQRQTIQAGDCLIKATDADINTGKELLREIGLGFGEKQMVIQPGSGGTKKCWHLENFLAVAKELDSRGADIIFLLGPAETERYSDETIEKISSVGKCLTDLSLTQVLGLLSCVEGFIGNDSGITHLAAALGVRTYSIYGPTDPEVYKSIGPDVTVFASKIASFAKKPSMRSQRKFLEVVTA
ncbi:MAG: glycosyltransferase family 9 protein [Planctomycetota bacterium]|jgi:ADP-heptose:LPS heptosyltransferase